MAGFNPIMLIAVPQLVDPNFKRSVILILHHDTQGAFGLVVNDPLKLSLIDFAANQKLPCRFHSSEDNVYCGGPVEPYRGWILHGSKEIMEKQEVASGLYLSGSNESLRECFAKGLKPFRFLLGYAGWGPHQLEKEMEEGSWITTEVDPRYIFLDNPEDIWDAMLHDMGVDPATLALGTGLH